MIPRLLRRLTTAEALGMSVVTVALFIFIHGIVSSFRGTDFGDFLWLCLCALWISFGLRRIRLNGIPASAGIAALGILLAWVLGARLTRPLLELMKAVVSSIPQVLSAVRNAEPMNATVIVEAWSVVAQASSALWARLQDWLPGFNARGTILDPLIRNMVWMLILWLCAAWMGWFAERRSAVRAFLPSMAALAAVTSYSERRFEYLWMMVVLLLILMGLWSYKNHTLQWLKKRIDYSESIRIDNSQAVALLVLFIGTVAFITPSVSWNDIVEFLREDREADNEVAELLGIQEPPGSAGAADIQQPSLPRDHLLTGGPTNSENIVMTIRTGEFPPAPNPSVTFDAPRYYWRSTVYDRYVGAGWVTGAVTRQNIAANTPLIPGLLNGYRLVHLDVRMIEPEGGLFWSGTLFSADIPLIANWRVRPPSDLFADQPALLQADLFAVETNAGAYQADAYVPMPGIADLRAADAEYPVEIRVRYLQLPATVPNRVHDLARQITDGLINPYERAQAIENYLRGNYPYDLEVPPPPEGRDVADYFLFDLKKGYCDYFATAMVVLARSSGIPARFVSGYSPGAYDAFGAQYIVRESDAHSWAEVYFPGIGWIEFEPTASLPEIERTGASIPASLEDRSGEDSASELLSRFRAEQILLWSSPLLVVLMSAILYFAFLERWRVLRLSPEAAADVVYQRFYRAARPLAGAWTRAETSTEFLYKVTFGLSVIQRRTRFKKISAATCVNATRLTDIYQASLFKRQKIHKRDAVTAWRTWRHLRGQLFIMKVLLKAVKNEYIAHDHLQ
jgi:transglutaminase-like putative cysteine protease